MASPTAEAAAWQPLDNPASAPEIGLALDRRLAMHGLMAESFSNHQLSLKRVLPTIKAAPTVSYDGPVIRHWLVYDRSHPADRIDLMRDVVDVRGKSIKVLSGPVQVYGLDGVGNYYGGEGGEEMTPEAHKGVMHQMAEKVAMIQAAERQRAIENLSSKRVRLRDIHDRFFPWFASSPARAEKPPAGQQSAPARRLRLPGRHAVPS
jgi:hypothetical protein